MRILGSALSGAFALGLVASATAHHSTGMFDGNTITTIQGEVTRVAWQSPHVYVFLQGSEPGGESAEWRFESLPVPIMLREGWERDSLREGEIVTVEAFRLRNSSDAYAWLRRVIKEDGTVLDPGKTGSPEVSAHERVETRAVEE